MDPKVWSRFADRYTTDADGVDTCKGDSFPIGASPKPQRRFTRADIDPDAQDPQYYWPRCRCCKSERRHWVKCYFRKNLDLSVQRRIGSKIMRGELEPAHVPEWNPETRRWRSA